MKFHPLVDLIMQEALSSKSDCTVSRSLDDLDFFKV